MLPILFQSPEFILYSYPLLMGIGWGVAYQIYFSFPHSSTAKAQGLFWGVFLFAWVGAKILFLLTHPEGSLSHAQSVSFWMGGGFVFYGGLLGALLYLGGFKIFQKELGWNDLWPMLPALAFGHGIGRMGCFLAGCCFGKPTELWWGVHLHGADRHPTQLLESFALLGLGCYLLKSKKPRAILLAQYFILYGVLRAFIEVLRGDEIRGSWGFMSPSSLISLVLILVGSLILLRKNRDLV
jgi:phosphatidylglycerol:prolipoprotein diacylglycerol transferase